MSNLFLPFIGISSDHPNGEPWWDEEGWTSPILAALAGIQEDYDLAELAAAGHPVLVVEVEETTDEPPECLRETWDYVRKPGMSWRREVRRHEVRLVVSTVVSAKGGEV